MTGLSEQIVEEHRKVDDRHDDRDERGKRHVVGVCRDRRSHRQKEGVQLDRRPRDFQPSQSLVERSLSEEEKLVKIDGGGQQKTCGVHGDERVSEPAHGVKSDAGGDEISRIEHEKDEPRKVKLTLGAVVDPAVVRRVLLHVLDHGQKRSVFVAERLALHAFRVAETADGVPFRFARADGDPTRQAERDRAEFISGGVDECGGQVGRPVRKGRQRNKERGEVDEEQKKGRHDERDERDRP